MRSTPRELVTVTKTKKTIKKKMIFAQQIMIERISK